MASGRISVPVAMVIAKGVRAFDTGRGDKFVRGRWGTACVAYPAR